MIRLAAAFALAATSAAAGGLAPPIVALNFAVPQPVLARCPVVPAALDSLRAQGFTRIVAEPGQDVARVSALRNGQWTVVGLDCRTGATLFQETVVAADADLVADGVYILEGTDVDTARAAASLDADLDGVTDVATVSAGADLSSNAALDVSPTSAELSVEGSGDIIGNGRSGDATLFQRIDATDATAGGAISDSRF